MICAGIDVGSRTIKIVLIEGESKKVIASIVTDQGVEQDKLALNLFEKLLHDNAIAREEVAWWRVVGRSDAPPRDRTIGLPTE